MNRPGRLVALLLMVVGLLLQVNAPVQAASMVGAAADPLFGAAICSAHAKPGQAPAEQDRQQKSLCPACLVCCGAGYAVLEAPPLLPCPATRAPVAHADFASAQLRASPPPSARARGPPTFA